MINREIKYERNLTGSFIKIPTAYQAEFDEKLMLRKNLRGLIQVEKCFYNEAGQYWYNITGLQSLETRVKLRSLDYHFVNKLLYKICEELRILELNLMSPEMLLLEPEFIFLSNSSQEISFMLYPGSDRNIMAALRELMEFVLLNLDHTDSAGTQEVYGIYELILNEASTVADLKRELETRRDQRLIKETEEEEPSWENPAWESPAWESPAWDATKEKPVRKKETLWATLWNKIQGKFDQGPEVKKPKPKESKKEQKAPKIIKAQKEKRADREQKHRRKSRRSEDSYLISPEQEFEEDYELEPAAEKNMEIYPTVCILTQAPKPKGILKYEGEEALQDIILEDYGSLEVRIGKGREVEARIPEETISRIHARITIDDGGYFLEDLNSTNGTYLNEELLPFHTKRKLNKEDKIRFAQIQYRFV